MSGTAESWQAAWDAIQARIEAHPDFRKLVREVAVAESPNMPHSSWYRRNSRTMGLWITRGMPHRPHFTNKTRRAWALAGRMAEELDVYEGRLPLSEGTARVYGAAQLYVRQRLAGPA